MWARNKIASSLKCAPRNDRDAVVIARRAQPDEAISKIRYTNVPCDLGYRSGITQSILLIVVSFLFLATSAYAATAIYRSVGPSATTPISSGPTYTLSISGTTATFSNNMPVNVGVGDAIQYDSDNNGSIDAICFIHGRTDSRNYTVMNAAGAAPTATSAADTDWAIYRAYTSLSNAEGGTENTGINSTVRNFDTWTDGKDLTVSDEQWNIACYAYGTTADTAGVSRSGWTTGVDTYLRIFTPTSLSEVGVSQRHEGKWDNTKYSLQVTNSTCLNIYSRYERVEGLQVKSIATGDIYGNAILIRTDNINSDVRVSNNIIRADFTGLIHEGSGIATIWASSVTAKIWNNILYDFFGGAGGSDEAIATGGGGNKIIYVYNNTFCNNEIGIVSSGTPTVILKNNISYNNTDNYAGTFDSASINNLSGPTQSDAPGSNPRNATRVAFVDEANRNLHLAANDTGAKDYGVSDPGSGLFSDDIDGHVRAGSWDIGADEVVNAIYRSVGAGATSPVVSGGSNALTITDSTATFASDLPANVGVGDAIQYDSDNGGTIDAVCFIHGRTDATHYTVRKADGTNPTATSIADNDWAVYRAYTRIYDAERGVENTGINDTVENFDTWSNGRDLVANNEQWNIACYANGTNADTTGVDINGWTTAADNYLKIYTPVVSSEVGVSQRHQGKWNNAKYHMDRTDIAFEITNVGHVRIDGLQILITTSTESWVYGVWAGAGDGGDIRVSNNIIRAALSGTANEVFGISAAYFDRGTRFIRIWNNIIYDFVNGSNVTRGLILSWGWQGYAYNNTIYNTYRPVWVAASPRHTVKNTIAEGTSTCYEVNSGSWDSSSDYNISNDGTAPGSHSKKGATVSFEDAANDDFHLTFADTTAKNSGINLSEDADLAFSGDIDGQTRTGAWDIGADEMQQSVVRNAVVRNATVR